MTSWLDWTTNEVVESQTPAGGLFDNGAESSSHLGALVDRDGSNAGTSADNDTDEENVSTIHDRSKATPSVSPLFNHDDADVIFRSCDGVDFRLHKVILRLTSPVFRDMFSLPDEPTQGDAPQTVDISESSETLENLLSFCYPMENPDFMQLSRLLSVLGAAKKYDITFIIKPLMSNLKKFLPSEPLRLYAIAYAMEDGDLARAAAKRLLDVPSFYNPPDPPSELELIPALALCAVGAYRAKCVEAARAAFLDYDWIGRGIRVSRKGNADTSSAWVWLACASCTGSGETFTVANPATGHRGTIRPRAWWQKYADAVALELLLRPLGSVATLSCMTRPAIEAALQCKTCAPKAAVELTEYSEAMAKRIDEATSKIEIELPF
ncbi:hypothetical protein C8Q78DRAFT_540381 [Trametes maxima]|nr:hypothetical protein C8Q78DRAFT_540381 [Trametes maxima]